MTCYHPLHAFLSGKHDNGSDYYKITSNKVMSVFFDEVTSHWYLSENPYKYANNEYLDIPCGQCVGCRLDYAKDWTTRMMLEALYHEKTMFVTLTYDDEHVPHSRYCEEETGEIKDILTLFPEDFTKFMKRLRYYYNKNELRFYMCGEYGSKTLRPHYHMICFGLDLDDLKPLKESGTGNLLYESETLSKAWKKGFINCSEASYETMGYVARYVMKKLKGKDAAEYEALNIVPEYTNMSRMPGIGKQYYDDYRDEIYMNDEIILSNGKTVRPPRYFDKLLRQDDENLYNSVLDKRIENAKIADDTKKIYYGDKYERLKREEIAKKGAVSKLIREL